jgi:hypothetical protein
MVSIQPAPILLIHRDILKPGAASDYRRIEAESARLMREALPFQSQDQVVFPNSYPAVEPLTGPSEMWFLTAWRSMDDFLKVGEEFGRNPALAEALQRNALRKKEVTLDPITVFANRRPDLSSDETWSIGIGRFLVITATKAAGPLDGTVFEATDEVRFGVTAAQTIEEAAAIAALRAADTRVFAVRPELSRPATEWIEQDPEFWRI